MVRADCVKVHEKTPYEDLGEWEEEYSLADFEQLSIDDGMRCVWFDALGRRLVVCTDGERVRLAYTVKC